MSVSTLLALFAALAVLAAIPSVSVLAVTARSAAFGVRHGVFTTLGIVAGDLVFIVLAVTGLTFLADAMGELFTVVKVLGGIYLIWLGIHFIRSLPKPIDTQTQAPASLSSSFFTGLFLTLGDQKAIVFYLGFLPAFLDLRKITLLDAILVITAAAVAVGGTKLLYAWTAARVGRFAPQKILSICTVVGGCVVFTVGVILLLEAVS